MYKTSQNVEFWIEHRVYVACLAAVKTAHTQVKSRKMRPYPFSSREALVPFRRVGLCTRKGWLCGHMI